MSKSLRLLLPILVWAAAINAQDVNVSISISGHVATVTGSFAPTYKRKDNGHLSFLNNYAGATGLAERFSKVAVTIGSESRSMTRRTIGEYEASDGPLGIWSYEVDLRPRGGPAAAGHTSWVTGDAGLLIIDDILPQEGTPYSARLNLEVPKGWKIHTTAMAVDADTFDVSNIEKAAFILGRNMRPVDAGAVQLIVDSGEWQFTDKDAAAATREVFSYYSRLFGSSPTTRAQVGILKFPTDTALDQWEADTRGSSVTILSSDTPFQSQSIQRLHEQLRHEIFHLWFPNGVNLSGNYDWFYEGFAIYQSLKLGVAVNRIRFDDYLNTLSRAYAIDNFGSKRMSLIEASKNRFGGNNTQVYARGMLVGFLCDLAMLEWSKGKRSTDDLVRELYRKYPLTGPRTDGNSAVLDLMKASPELVPIADRYITGAETIDWAALLKEAGLEAGQNGREIVLKAVAKPSGRQKGILDKLGYNNWRKSGSK
jgi:predicted metalloprotease with PDZ domain